MAGSVIGLDISSRGLLAVEIEDPNGRKPKLVRAAEIALDEGHARDTEVIDIAAVSSALTRLWKDGKFKSKRVVLGAGNQRVLVREHTAPRMPLAQLRQALPYQVQDLLPVPVAETILDFYPIEPSPQAPETEIRGLLVAALKDAVETNVAALSDAGLSVVQVDLAPFAGIRAITQAAVPAGTHTVVSIAPRTTTISVIKDGVPQFVRIVPAGGETITDAVAEILNADRSTSEKVKRHLGLEQGADPRHKPVSQAMLDALKGIFGSIRSTNGYYLSNSTDDAVDSVILLGAETALPGFARAVVEYVGLPASVGRPLAGITVGPDVPAELIQRRELDLAVPIGLALGNA
ncbi:MULTISPECIES: type IV pilus assembly protein PilM [unclassified Leucobacter]|uniref:type IV pilus assembly protein PilM n=1 Tax=unclassified Leucobacter TaxID=2621730 RepID=UPI00165E7678|nr:MULTISPECIES: type IV pilus assembly protein PilM [unclassified Leucobacter]MBC9925920.1 type IV pilus assembly protein PilM [Leucobacter sp. cx-169]